MLSCERSLKIKEGWTKNNRILFDLWSRRKAIKYSAYKQNSRNLHVIQYDRLIPKLYNIILEESSSRSSLHVFSKKRIFLCHINEILMDFFISKSYILFNIKIFGRDEKGIASNTVSMYYYFLIIIVKTSQLRVKQNIRQRLDNQIKNISEIIKQQKVTRKV